MLSCWSRDDIGTELSYAWYHGISTLVENHLLWITRGHLVQYILVPYNLSIQANSRMSSAVTNSISSLMVCSVAVPQISL